MAVETKNAQTSKHQGAKTNARQSTDSVARPAPETPDHDDMSSGRRFAIGANVAVAIVAATALLIAVNWIFSIKNYRKDIASIGNYGISERTKRIVKECDGDITLSLLYRPDEKDEKQKHYIDRLQDYASELTRFSPNLQVTHVRSDSQREKLVARLSTTFGGEAKSHTLALASFERLRSDLAAELQQQIAAAQPLLESESWLGAFPLFARVVKLLEQDHEQLNETAEEIAQLTPATGIPKYGEATEKAKQTIKEIKDDFQTIAKTMLQFTTLADETTRPDSAHIATLRQVAREAKAAVDSLRQLIGNEGDAPPEDVAAALKAYADRGVKVSETLDQLVARVDGFAKQFPMVQQHANWATQVRVGGLPLRMEVGGVLQEAGRSLQQLRLGLLGVIDKGDPAQLQETLVTVRRQTGALENNASVCEQILTDLADSLAKLDEGSRQMLEAARDGNLLKDQIAESAVREKEFEKLPELKLASVADELKQENIVVVELTEKPKEKNGTTRNKVRVIDFNTVWPVQESVGGRQAAADEINRTFNGDSSISSAILALSAEKPFGRVVLVFFEPPPPQQQNPFMRPPQSSIPSRALNQVRSRLEAANFKVANWNLATDKEKPAPAEGEEGLKDIYVCLPPTPPQSQNPFGGGPTPDQFFTEEHRNKIRDVLSAGGRAIFLTTWEVQSSPFAGFSSPAFPYGQLLREGWGLDVRSDQRIVQVEPDRQSAYGFRVKGKEFQYMPVTGWTDQPIGVPMAGTRFLAFNACPIETAPEAPDGVSTTPILQIPKREEYISAGIEEIVEIVDTLRNPKSDGRIDPQAPPRTGPFDLMVAATRVVKADEKKKNEDADQESDAETQNATEGSTGVPPLQGSTGVPPVQGKESGDRTEARVVVIGFGGSLIDEYLMQPVVVNVDPIQFDPPPTECLDLFVNTVFWLNDQESYIGRGPVHVPRMHAVSGGELAMIRWFVWGIWPVLVFVPGIFLWYVRRR